VGLIVSNPGVTRALRTVFEADWAESATGREKEAESGIERPQHARAAPTNQTSVSKAS
jgi:hypothetical protein